ncbi:hypothetical protein ACFY2M_18120 [Streptomyces sp. NPDC001276]|uniref:hypothetical protein n=1 Tax=Streptomyces sp. NPDC001276 TaxID=3364555 RepID=UPI0036A23E15
MKQESELAAQMEIINAKVLQAKYQAGKERTLDLLVPPGEDGLPKYTDDMKAMVQALGAIVDPAKAWQAAQDKVTKANKNATASLQDYLKELRSQLKAQRGFQGNLTKLAMAGYGDPTDHFAKLGVSSAPILDELVKQLAKGKTKVADELGLDHHRVGVPLAERVPGRPVAAAGYRRLVQQERHRRVRGRRRDQRRGQVRAGHAEDGRHRHVACGEGGQFGRQVAAVARHGPAAAGR